MTNRGISPHAESVGKDVLDLGRIDELRNVLGGQEFLDLMIRTFLDDAPLQLDQIAAGLKNQDASSVVRIAHGLKTNCADFGATLLREKFKSLEFMGRGNELAGSEQLLAAIREDYEKVKRALTAILSS